ncbi:MAG: M6 family metalloprotease domain-containing protein [Actinomycetota bacterium]
MARAAARRTFGTGRRIDDSRGPRAPVRVATAVVIAMLIGGLVAPAPAGARERFPRHLDPRSYEVPEDMRWSDFRPIRGPVYLTGGNEPPKTLRAALILGDFSDQRFRVAETTIDPTGQRGLGVADPAQYWLDYLFKDSSADNANHGHNVNDYWLENSYGLIGVDAEAFGPYTLDGKMLEYGISDFGDSADCPEGADCSKEFDVELAAASAADVTLAQQQHGDFDFRFLLHAGYDESGVWQNFGLAEFENKDAVTEEFGAPGFPAHRNWATTRYVDWTSFFSAQQIWSHALPGALSTQGESDGGSTYAHELSHILGVLDNYNNPYDENPKRAYSGPWDMMSRGTFNGPGGPFERWQIPPTEGGTMGSQHMLRNKIRMGFTPATEVRTISRAELDTAGVVKVDVLQRESAPPVDDPDLYSGIRVPLGTDRSSCDFSKPKCDGGEYDYYDVEVVNRQGFDSFIPDHGVLIAKTKTADAAPFIWVIDAFPKDLTNTDYVAADGTRVPYTVGDYRQLSDATFHAGTARGARSRYVDEDNGLAFNVVGRRVRKGRLMYSVAVQSLTAAPLPREPEVKQTRANFSRGEVTKDVFTVTNTGQGDAVYQLRVTKRGSFPHRLLNDLIFVPAGGTKKIEVWARKTSARQRVRLVARAL